MRRTIVDNGWLRDRRDGAPLRLDVYEEADGQIVEGVLHTVGGDWFPIEASVPCLLRGSLRPDTADFQQRHSLSDPAERGASDVVQEHLSTIDTFSDKWKRFRNYGMEADHQEFLFEWYCKKLGLADRDALAAFYRSKRLILEVGAGSGFNSRFIAEQTSGNVIVADISLAAETAYGNTSDLENCHVMRADLMDLPLADASFDLIMADGVLHHTPNTYDAVRALYAKLAPGGQFFFYVYRKMGAARQFCDQHIREEFTKLPAQECYEACEALTELGRELSGLNVTIRLEKPIPVLGIPEGTHDVQRLIYYSFVKCFWNDAFDFETNNMVNFDWYHPQYAWQHTEAEVIEWLDELGVQDYQIHPANPNGISVLLTKPAA